MKAIIKNLPAHTAKYMIFVATIWGGTLVVAQARANEDPIDSALKGGITVVFVSGLYLAWKGAALLIRKLRSRSD